MAYFTLIQNLWNDDCGGIISSEYLMLGGILGFGTVSGLTAMRDASVEEMKEMSSSIRSVREQYAPKQSQKHPQPGAPSRHGQPTPSTTGQTPCEYGVCSAIP